MYCKAKKHEKTLHYFNAGISSIDAGLLVNAPNTLDRPDIIGVLADKEAGNRPAGRGQVASGAGARPSGGKDGVHRALPLDLRRRRGTCPGGDLRRKRQDHAPLLEAGPPDHRRHGAQKTAETVWGIHVRDNHAAVRAAVDGHDIQQAAGGMGKTHRRRPHRHRHTRPVPEPRRDHTDHR